MSPTTVLITGANAGIGRAAALQLAQEGHTVLMGCRNTERGEQAREAIVEATGNARVELHRVDLSLQSSIRRACDELLERHPTLDAVVHNAAFFDIAQRERRLTEEGVELTWATNHLGPVLMTELLMPALRAAPQGRVITVASKGLVLYPWLKVDLDDPEFARRPFKVQRAYYQSKLAQLCWTAHRAEALRGTGVTVNGVRVTNVAIDLDRYPGLSWWKRGLYRMKRRFAMSPEEMARTYAWMATDPGPGEMTGAYVDEEQALVEMNAAARDEAHREAVVRLTYERLGLTPRV